MNTCDNEAWYWLRILSQLASFSTSNQALLSGKSWRWKSPTKGPNTARAPFGAGSTASRWHPNPRERLRIDRSSVKRGEEADTSWRSDAANPVCIISILLWHWPPWWLCLKIGDPWFSSGFENRVPICSNWKSDHDLFGPKFSHSRQLS